MYSQRWLVRYTTAWFLCLQTHCHWRLSWLMYSQRWLVRYTTAWFLRLQIHCNWRLSWLSGSHYWSALHTGILILDFVHQCHTVSSCKVHSEEALYSSSSNLHQISDSLRELIWLLSSPCWWSLYTVLSNQGRTLLATPSICLKSNCISLYLTPPRPRYELYHTSPVVV